MQRHEPWRIIEINWAAVRAGPVMRVISEPPTRALRKAAAHWVDDVVAELPSLVPADEAMRVLHVSRRTLGRLLATGRLRGHRPCESGSSRVLIPRAELKRYLQSMQ